MSYLHLLQIWVALPCVPHNSHPIMKKKKEKNQYIRQNKNKKRRPSNGGFRIFSLFCTCDKTEKHVFSISSPSSSKFTIFPNLITNKDSRRSFLAINTYQFPWIILWQSQNLKKFQKNLILYFFKPEVQDCTVYFFFLNKRTKFKKYRPQNNIQLSFLPIYRRPTAQNLPYFLFQYKQRLKKIISCNKHIPVSMNHSLTITEFKKISKKLNSLFLQTWSTRLYCILFFPE